MYLAQFTGTLPDGRTVTVRPGSTDGLPTTVVNRFRYAGEQFDKVTGAIYLRARYYDPTVGRFTQEDTYRGDGLNLYAYVGNNPVNAWDPSGYEKCEGTETSSTAYIFYALSDSNNAGFEDRAKADAERWKREMGTDAVTIAITSETQFLEEWNKMDGINNPIQYVGMYFHSNAHNLFINTDNEEYITANKSGWTTGNQPNSSTALYIGNLDNKQISNLYLYSCNSGHLDYINGNLAVTFLKNQSVENVFAWDGSMKWSNDGEYIRLANNQHYFDSDYKSGERLP